MGTQKNDRLSATVSLVCCLNCASSLLRLFAIEANARKSFVDFFECLFAEVGNAKKVVASAMEQVFHRENASFFKAVGGADGESNFRSAHVETFAGFAKLLP